MKIRNLIIIALISILCLAVCGCSSEEPVSEAPDLGINWDSLISGITEEELSSMGLYTDMDTLKSDAEEFGSISFTNYDPDITDSFKKVDYQLCIDYGLGCTYEGDTANYFDRPVYSLLLTDNKSDGCYSCICDEDFALLSEYGRWFLSEDKDSFIAACLGNCSAVLFSN